MSHRPIKEKQARKAAKSLRREVPASLDLIEYLVARGHAKSRNEARKLIADGRVYYDSHPLRTVFVSAGYRDGISVREVATQDS